MTNSENIAQFGPNAYAKPATGLNILRETIMGRDLFDQAFKTYAKRWAFRHPEPADFFRTMEDASGEDLDWFWRGWFYGTDPVDIALTKVTIAKPDLNAQPKNMEFSYKIDPTAEDNVNDISKSRERDAKTKFAVDQDKDLQDFYYRYARGQEKLDLNKNYVTNETDFTALSKDEQNKLKNMTAYQLDFENKGGMVMPIILEFTFEDGSKLSDNIPAQIWRHNEQKVSKTYYFDKVLKSVQLDPRKQTADIDTSNNFWSANVTSLNPENKFEVFKQKQASARGASNGRLNPMQAAGKK